MKKIRVLIVDDSKLFRETLKRLLEQDEEFEVVGVAQDPFEARDLILDLKPDVMTLDVEMPRMNGIEFLKRLLPQFPLPTIVISAVNDIVFDALAAGAVDFVKKPEGQDGLDKMSKELMVKLKIASVSKVNKWQVRKNNQHAKGASGKQEAELIAIGASTGGTEATFEVLKHLPGNLPPIVIVQHMPPVFTRMYAERLNRQCEMTVVEATHHTTLAPGHAYIAPGDHHMEITGKKEQMRISLHQQEKMNGHRPSVDVLFHSIAGIDRIGVIAVILTGMGADGARGLGKLKDKGAITIGQNQASSVVYGMPKVAFELGHVMYQLDVRKIGPKIIEVL